MTVTTVIAGQVTVSVSLPSVSVVVVQEDRFMRGNQPRGLLHKFIYGCWSLKKSGGSSPPDGQRDNSQSDCVFLSLFLGADKPMLLSIHGQITKLYRVAKVVLSTGPMPCTRQHDVKQYASPAS